MTKMATTPIYGKKPFKIILLRNRRADFYETWYVALGTPAHHSSLNDDPGVTLTYFTARSNLVTLAFSMGKNETVYFSETIAASDLKNSRSRHLIRRYVSIEGHSHFLTLAQGCIHTKILIGFSQKILCRSKPNFV